MWFSFAQHTDLTSQRWFVQSITLSGITTNMPSDPVNFPFIDINFVISNSNLVGSSSLVTDDDCQMSFVAHVNYTGTNILDFNDFTPTSTITTCDTSASDFMNLYVNFYQDELTENFTYTITDLSDRKTLIVTSNTGNQLEYSSKIFDTEPADIRISENIDWHLIELKINDINYNVPSGGEIAAITAQFNAFLSQNFNTAVCAYQTGEINFIENENIFHLYELGETLNDCGIPENNTFQSLYLGFYRNNGTNPFTFEITEWSNDQHGNQNLIISDVLGNQATYFTALVSVEDYIDSVISIYPNPVINELNIEKKINVNIDTVLIYDYLGKELISTNNKEINMSNLDKGVYFVKIILKNGKIGLKKIIKS